MAADLRARLWRLRARLARRLLGYAYMEDPLEGQDGLFVVIRTGGVIATTRADTFTVTLTGFSGTFARWQDTLAPTGNR